MGKFIRDLSKNILYKTRFTLDHATTYIRAELFSLKALPSCAWRIIRPSARRQARGIRKDSESIGNYAFAAYSAFWASNLSIVFSRFTETTESVNQFSSYFLAFWLNAIFNQGTNILIIIILSYVLLKKTKSFELFWVLCLLGAFDIVRINYVFIEFFAYSNDQFQGYAYRSDSLQANPTSGEKTNLYDALHEAWKCDRVHYWKNPYSTYTGLIGWLFYYIYFNIFKKFKLLTRFIMRNRILGNSPRPQH